MIQVKNKSEEYSTLVLFTALAPLAVGGLVGLLVVRGAGHGTGIDWTAMLVLATGLLALAASLFHLGRPWRAPLAVLRPGTSWLSREVIFFGLFLFSMGVYAIMPALNLGGLARFMVGFAAALIGLAGTIATGETYHLRARPAWDQWSAVASFPLGALSTGILFGCFIAWQSGGHTEIAGYVWSGAAILLILALMLTWIRSSRSRPGNTEDQASRKLAFGRFFWLVVVRVTAVVIALVLLGTGGEVRYLAWIPALLGEFADRILFFRAVVPVTLKGRYL